MWKRSETVELKQLDVEYLWGPALKTEQPDLEGFSRAARRTLQLMREMA